MISPLIALLSLGFGCLQGAIPAPASARLKAPGDIKLGWSNAYQPQHDQVGMVLWQDLLVYDSEEDNMPLESIEVEIRSGAAGVYLIPAEAVKLVGYPEASVDPTDQAAIEDACTDADGVFKADPEWCAWYWDTDSQQFYEVGQQYVSTSSNYTPNYFVGRTDNRGLLRLYMYVDSMPVYDSGETDDEGNPVYRYGAAQIQMSIGVDAAAFEIRVQAE
jgi:hypothetical protein